MLALPVHEIYFKQRIVYVILKYVIKIICDLLLLLQISFMDDKIFCVHGQLLVHVEGENDFSNFRLETSKLIFKQNFTL